MSFNFIKNIMQEKDFKYFENQMMNYTELLVNGEPTFQFFDPNFLKNAYSIIIIEAVENFPEGIIRDEWDNFQSYNINCEVKINQKTNMLDYNFHNEKKPPLINKPKKKSKFHEILNGRLAQKCPTKNFNLFKRIECD